MATLSVKSSARVLRLCWLTPWAAGIAACAGPPLASRGSVESTIGRGTYSDILNEVPALLRRVGYAIYDTRETGSTLRIETNWQDRVPFEDEAAAGVNAARTRFVAQARKVGPDLFTLRITAENEVQGLTDAMAGLELDPRGGWSTMPATKMYKAYVDDITTEIKLKVDAGLRTHGAPLGPFSAVAPAWAATPS